MELLSLFKSGTPGRIRTYDIRIRSALLYPSELRALNFRVYSDLKLAPQQGFEPWT